MPIFANAPVRLQPYLGYRSASHLRVSARALRQKLDDFDASSTLASLRTMLRQFSSHEAEGVRVRLVLKNREGHTLLADEQATNGEGFVHFDLPLAPALDLPPETAWEVASMEWENEDGAQSIDLRILAPAAGATLGVISDIDDTVLETGITGGIENIARNWKRVLAQMPQDRIAVPGASGFYEQLGGGRIDSEAGATARRHKATKHPFFYVSSSPWNLFSYLVAFKRANSLPVGPIALRDWGLNSETFGHESHGAHKRAAIDTILGTYPDMRFALVGDDTQGDLAAFAHAVAHHPGRIAAVFLRTISQEALNAEELAARDVIKAAGVPLWLGGSFDKTGDFLETLDLAGDEGARELVEVVEKKEKAAA